MDIKARGVKCGKCGTEDVYVCGKHFILADKNGNFLGFLSQKEARRRTIRSADGRVLYGKDGYIPPTYTPRPAALTKEE